MNSEDDKVFQGEAMRSRVESRRQFLKMMGAAPGAFILWHNDNLARAAMATRQTESNSTSNGQRSADYTLHIRTSPVEIAPDRIISLITYNGQFPGPLLRFKEGREVVVDVYNDTDTPAQLHWHGQKVSVDVDGAAEEGTPFIPAQGVFTPNPAGLRFYHTHNHAGSNLHTGQYSGEVGAVYIEPKDEPGRFDREEFIVLKEFEPTFSRGGDMPQHFLSLATGDRTLQDTAEAAMKAFLAKGMPHGYEVGYRSFTINGRILGHGEPIRVKQGQRILFHNLNGSATEIRSLALPGHSFQVLALDGNPVPRQASVPVLWLDTAERISAIVEMNHPGVWVLGDLDNDDRRDGMGIIVEYANRSGKGQWIAPSPFRWEYSRFAQSGATSAAADETIEMVFAKDNAAEEGFNRWTINGSAYPMNSDPRPASFHLKEGKRYRIRMQNASDDIHPIHLHRHSFELTSIAGIPTAGIIKDVLMVAGYQEAEVSCVADNPGLTLFHCHQQLHMDFGYMTLLDYV